MIAFSIGKGGSPELAQKLVNDSKALLSIQVDGEFFIISYKWEAMPLEILFKLEEEFDVDNPLCPDLVEKVIEKFEIKLAYNSFMYKKRKSIALR